MLESIKDSLRISGTDSDVEIQELIDAAKADLILTGVLESKVVDVDPLIKRAITSYCKAYYGYEDPKLAERFQEAYLSLKQHLTLSQEYSLVEVIIDEGL